jgi:hypothetical protein
MTMADASTPSVSEFDPHAVPYQFRVIRDIRESYDYSLGAHEVLLSGSVGSAKSILCAHLAVTHCTLYDRARFCLGRQSMPDLKETILQTCLDHMEGDLVEGEDFELNRTKGKITFSNNSEIVSRSWADKKFKRFRSVPLSAACVEELTENGEEMRPFYGELYGRLGRVKHVPERFVVSATNPDSPAHWAYRRFFIEQKPTRHVYKSKTTENPFLDPAYIQGLLENLDPKMKLRMIDGEWVEIAGEGIYHQYDRAVNFRDVAYAYNPAVPIRLCFDFNIGLGKPMSACTLQFFESRDEYHFGEDFVVEGADTEALLEEIEARGLLEIDAHFIIHGDATGKNLSTKSKRSDYTIIRDFLARFRRKDGAPLRFDIQVPAGNPPIRTRHNLMNAHFKNSLGRNRAFVYRGAAVLDEGFRLTRLKKGAEYLEDDTPAYQHVTTAAGYGLTYIAVQKDRKSSSQER